MCFFSKKKNKTKKQIRKSVGKWLRYLRRDIKIIHRLLEGVLKELIGHDIRMISERKNAELEEMSIQRDHVHLVVSVPPKLSISDYMGILKGKTAIKMFKSYPQLRQSQIGVIIFGRQATL